MSCEKQVLVRLICILGCISVGQHVAHAALLSSYLPAAMQALAYYIDLLQYEPLSMTTVEPPFIASVQEPYTTTTAATPNVTRATTKRPAGATSSSWWQPPSWWEDKGTTTTPKPTAPPTPPHRPAIFAPQRRFTAAVASKEGYELFEDIDTNSHDFDGLTLDLIRDIVSETNHDDFTNDVESLDNFLRLYDDNYGRASFDPESAMDRWSSTSTAGKKRVPPTKPYVEFLLVYDLLKRDAKSANLSKYEGYTEELLQELQELSLVSAERQLFTIFDRMLKRGDVQRSDVVSRVRGIMKDLGNPESGTAKALRYIPAMPFVP